jgi:hypothetical protein
MFQVLKHYLNFSEVHCRKHGIFVARHPLRVLCVSLLVPVLLCIGLFRLKVETRPEKVLNLLQPLIFNNCCLLIVRPTFGEILIISLRSVIKFVFLYLIFITLPIRCKYCTFLLTVTTHTLASCDFGAWKMKVTNITSNLYFSVYVRMIASLSYL